MQRLSWKCNDDSLDWNEAKCTLKEARSVDALLHLSLYWHWCLLSITVCTYTRSWDWLFDAQLFTIPPYACAYVVTLIAGIRNGQI